MTLIVTITTTATITTAAAATTTTAATATATAIATANSYSNSYSNSGRRTSFKHRQLWGQESACDVILASRQGRPFFPCSSSAAPCSASDPSPGAVTRPPSHDCLNINHGKRKPRVQNLQCNAPASFPIVDRSKPKKAMTSDSKLHPRAPLSQAR